MIWTTTAPTTAGWYWLRFGPTDEDPCIGKLYDYDDEGTLWFEGDDSLYMSLRMLLEDHPNSEWAGPIPEPLPRELTAEETERIRLDQQTRAFLGKLERWGRGEA